MTGTILRTENLSVRFSGSGSSVSALSDVTLSVSEGEILGVVGETGCGKTTLAMSVMGLLPPNASITGRIEFQGRDLTTLPEDDRRVLRGDRISMVFQDPLSSLDPAFGVGEQVAETIRAHRPVNRREARERAIKLLGEVGIPAAEARYDDPPGRFSGGMRQRVVIATALANEPALLIADEPTTAVDVTIQSQILNLIRDLRQRHRTTVMLIAHDLGVVAQLCDRVCVMYAGQIAELAPVERVFGAPSHPYTQALLAALPTASHAPGSLRAIEGQVPDLADPPPGCRFAPRCPYRMERCDIVPEAAEIEPGHVVACWLHAASERPTERIGDE